MSADMKPRGVVNTTAANVVGRVELKGRDLESVERTALREVLRNGGKVPHFNPMRGLDKLATVKPSAPVMSGFVAQQAKVEAFLATPAPKTAQLDGQKTLDEAMKRRQWRTTEARRELSLKCADGVERVFALDTQLTSGGWLYRVRIEGVIATHDAPSEKLAKVYAQRCARRLAKGFTLGAKS